MWKLNIPNKVNIFLWKALHGIVAGMGILAQRHIPTSSQCPVCKGGCEDIGHLMFTCKKEKEVWKALGVNEIIEEALKLDNSVVLEEIIRNESVGKKIIRYFGWKETVAVGAWYIWGQRREFVKGEKIATASSSTFAMRALTANYRKVIKNYLVSLIKWEKPPYDFYRINSRCILLS